jgi:hypothetical protein
LLLLGLLREVVDREEEVQERLQGTMWRLKYVV